MVYRLLTDYKKFLFSLLTFVLLSVSCGIHSVDYPFLRVDSHLDSNVKEFRQNVSFYLLNKMTGKSLLIDLKVNTVGKLGNLYFQVKQCSVSDNSSVEESKALIDIWEDNSEKKRVRVFYGWMFSNEPATSLLKHSIYDVMIIKCY